MTKTEQQIERDFYTLVKNSKLGKNIHGDVYRSEMRPNDATTEDIVVKFLSGMDEQIQTGIVILNIYVRDKVNSIGRMVINHSRVGELQSLAVDFIENNLNTEYSMHTDGSMRTIDIEEIGQHLIVVRIRFNRLNN